MTANNLIFSQNASHQEVKIIESRLPLIKELSSRDNIYKQFSQTVNYNEKLIAQNQNHSLEMEFYSYTAKKYDDTLTLAAESGIPYDTLISINSISNAGINLNQKKLILPTAKGIFITKTPESNIEALIYQEFKELISNYEDICYNIKDRVFYFLPGKRLTPTQRAFFLDPSMQLPLQNISITSAFGFRNSPIYKRWKFHKGIDLAAKDGTPVYACQNGKVKAVLKMDPIFGNCLIIEHENAYSSVYAHLSDFCVKKGDIVAKGTEIAHTGHTGAVTGPHLHFELRLKGQALNPEDILDFSEKN